jgi:type IV pilus assembly protein PilE
MTLKNRKKNSGFSVIEILVVLVIIAILMLVVLPNFSSAGSTVKRQDAYTALTKLAFEEERFFAQNQTYTDTLSDLNSNYGTSANTFMTDERGENNYQITVTATENTYKLVATAVNDQTNDTYSAFILDHLGNQTRVSKSGQTENRWQ